MSRCCKVCQMLQAHIASCKAYHKRKGMPSLRLVLHCFSSLVVPFAEVMELRRPMRGMAIGGGRAQAKSTEALGQLSGSKAGLWEGRCRAQAARRDTGQLQHHARRRSLLRGEGLVAYPDGFGIGCKVGDVGWFLAGSIPDPGLALVQPDTGIGCKVGDVGWFLAGSIPDPGLALVQPDTRMGPKRGGEGIVEHPDASWRGDNVNVVEERKDGLPILELSVQVLQGGVLG
eukprot:s5656_g6.t1